MLIASFNGGPSDLAILLSLITAGLTGVIVGICTRKPSIAFVVGSALGAFFTGAILALGNSRGDASGLFLLGAFIFFCPMGLIISGLTAAVAAWITDKLAGGSDIGFDEEDSFEIQS